MGLFDFLKRKQPEPAPGPTFEPRRDHYAFAHMGLRMAAFGAPLQCLGALASPQAEEFLASIMEMVEEHCRTHGEPVHFSARDLRVHCTMIGANFPCAVVEMPPPQAVTEAYFVAIVLPENGLKMTPEELERLEMRLRYFTLELGFEMNGSVRTALCEWTKDGSHRNYGDGPPPVLDGFLKTLEGLVNRSVAS